MLQSRMDETRLQDLQQNPGQLRAVIKPVYAISAYQLVYAISAYQLVMQLVHIASDLT